MRALDFWKAVVRDRSDVLERVARMLDEPGRRLCVVGGVAVNAYTEPLIDRDIDVTGAAADLSYVDAHVVAGLTSGSDLRVRLQTDPRYATFPERAARRAVLGLTLPVASLEDVLASRVWAVADASHRPSAPLRGLTDIARLIEKYPRLRERVPEEILSRLFT